MAIRVAQLQRARGYVTLLSEEQPGIFTYKATGFLRPPTDVYLRPFGSMMVMFDPHYDTFGIIWEFGIGNWDLELG